MGEGDRFRIGRREGFDARAYKDRFDALERAGRYVHGEADFVMAFAPESVLDAGCGTGRVALELARRRHMLAWIECGCRRWGHSNSSGLK